MFARSSRFSFRSGMPKRNFSAQFFVIRYDTQKESFKCAVVVGKKVDKRAVARNRIKRQLVAIVKEITTDKMPFWIVIIARKPIKDAEKAKIKEELTKALQTANIL